MGVLFLVSSAKNEFEFIEPDESRLSKTETLLANPQRRIGDSTRVLYSQHFQLDKALGQLHLGAVTHAFAQQCPRNR